MQKFYQSGSLATCGSLATWGLSSQVSKLARERNNLVILNAVLNLTSWSWDLHSPKAHCGVPRTADTGCCALEIGKYQPQAPATV